MYVAVISSHGKPTEVKLFEHEHDARHFALDYSKDNGYEDKKGNTFEHDGHTHEWHWLEDYGDEDGCGVVVGEATEGAHTHPH